jgi:DNA-binding YbaB/EbfC family protein
MSKGRRQKGFSRQGGQLGGMLQKVQQLQEEMAKTQEALADETVSVTAGGGAIEITITGQQRLRAVKIDPDVLDPDDVEMLEDLIVAAVNEAIERSQTMAAERLSEVTGGLGLPGLPPGLV